MKLTADKIFKFTSIMMSGERGPDLGSFFIRNRFQQPISPTVPQLARALNLPLLVNNMEIIDVDKSMYDNNPYFRDVKIKDTFNKDNIAFREATFEDNEISLAVVECDTNLNRFMDTFKMIFMLQHGVISVPTYTRDSLGWMGINHLEIITNKKAVFKAKGRVLTAGLGLGYFAYMAALKPDVESVTVLEIDPKCIELFNEVVAPQIPKEVLDKINIIECDALEYFHTMNFKDYDYIYVDIWRSSSEITLFIHCMCLLEGYGVPVDYWIEPSFRVQLYTIVYGMCMIEDTEGEPVPTPNDEIESVTDALTKAALKKKCSLEWPEAKKVIRSICDWR